MILINSRMFWVMNDSTILTQNIRSVYKNIEDLELNLYRFKVDVDVVILTKCRLKTGKPIPML